MIEHWVKQDHIPVRQVGPDIEDGKAVTVIGIVRTPTEQAKQTIWHGSSQIRCFLACVNAEDAHR